MNFQTFSSWKVYPKIVIRVKMLGEVLRDMNNGKMG
jgi:hypothetical protein